MNTREVLQLESIKNGVHVLGMPSFDTPAFRVKRALLRACIDKIAEANTVIPLGPRQRSDEAKVIAEYRNLLRHEHLLPIADTGKPYFRQTPAIARALTVPHKRASNKTLLEAADRVYAAMKPHTKIFVNEFEFPADFLKQLRAITKHLRGLLTAHDAYRKRRDDADDVIEHQIREGRQQMQMIGGMVVRKFGYASTEADLWRSKNRIPARQGRPPELVRQRRARKAQLAEERARGGAAPESATLQEP